MKNIIIIALLLIKIAASAQVINDIAVVDSVLFVATENGIYNLSEKDGSLILLENNLKGKNIEKLKSNKNSLFALLSTKEMYISNNYGLNWSQIKETEKEVHSRKLAFTENKIFSRTNYLYESEDNGITWKENEKQSYHCNDIFSANNILLSVTYDGYFYSDDEGLTWKKTGKGLPNPKSLDKFTEFIFYGGEYYIGIRNWMSKNEIRGVYKTKNLDEKWIKAGLNDTDIEYIATNKSNILAIHYGDIFYSNYILQPSWKKCYGIINPKEIYSLVNFKNKFYSIVKSSKDNKEVYDIYISTNNGIDWSPYKDWIRIQNEDSTYFKEKEDAALAEEKRREIEDKKYHANIFYKKGLDYYYKKTYYDYELAIIEFTKAINEDPTDSKFYTNRGAAYERIGKYKLAEEDYAKAVALNSKTNIDAYRMTPEEKAYEEWIKNSNVCPECKGSGSFRVSEQKNTVTEIEYEKNVIIEKTYVTPSHEINCPHCNGKGRIPKE